MDGLKFDGGFIDVKCNENESEYLERNLLAYLTQLYCGSASIPYPLPIKAKGWSITSIDDDPGRKLLNYVEKELCDVVFTDDGFQIKLIAISDACALVADECRKYIKLSRGYKDKFEFCFDNTFEYAIRSFFFSKNKQLKSIHAEIVKTYPKTGEKQIEVYDTVDGELVKK